MKLSISPYFIETISQIPLSYFTEIAFQLASVQPPAKKLYFTEENFQTLLQ